MAAPGGDGTGDPGVRRQRPGPGWTRGRSASPGWRRRWGRPSGLARRWRRCWRRPGRPDAVEVAFAGADRGVQGGLEHDYERSLPVAEAMRPEVLLAWGSTAGCCHSQHGYPLRLVVPGWYGMTSVKWLRRISVLGEPFEGYQQTGTYLIHLSEDDPGTPVTRIQPRSLLLPPRHPRVRVPPALLVPRPPPAGRPRLVGPGPGGRRRGQHRRRPTCVGRADRQPSPWAWAGWSFAWEATSGRTSSGRTATLQHPAPGGPWNTGGYANNAVQRVEVTVRP